MPVSQQTISQLIKQEVADILGVAPGQVDENIDIDRFALNSSAVVSLIGSLEEHLGLELSPSLFFEFKTIAKSAAHLAELYAESKSQALA